MIYLIDEDKDNCLLSKVNTFLENTPYNQDKKYIS